MSEKYDKLITNFPRTFSKIKLGISCGDGWYDLLHNLCLVVEQEIEQAPLELQDQIYAVQVKSKFGGLCFYMNRSTPYINGAITMAESMSYHLCETCGATSTMKNVDGWSAVLCDLHFEEELKARARR